MAPELHLPDLSDEPLGRSGPAPRPREPWPQRLRDGVAAYLPLLLMVALALGTWWLVKNSPGERAPASPVAVRHEPDYEMERFQAQRYGADGRMVLRLEGERMRHYPDTDELEIDTVRLQAWSPEGQRTEATARRALASGDGRQVRLLGGAEVRSEVQGGEPLTIRGDNLLFEPKAERLLADEPVQVLQGGTTLEAQGLRYDHASRVVALTGRVRAVAPAAVATRRVAP